MEFFNAKDGLGLKSLRSLNISHSTASVFSNFDNNQTFFLTGSRLERKMTKHIWTACLLGVMSCFLPQLKATDEIIIYTSDIPTSQIFGRWTKNTDTSAAGGSKLSLADLSEPKVATASPGPANYFDVTFNADAGKQYHVWLRMRAQGDYYGNDSVHVQFSDSLDLSGAANYRMGTSSSISIVLEEGTGAGILGWGWNDNHYGALGANIQFASTGTHTLRVQQREDGTSIDQIVISAATYLSSAPGILKNDTTIVPKTGTPPPPPPPTPSLPGEAELPRVYVDTTYTPPTGKTITVPAGGDFQAALNAANLGDVITLQAGASYIGPFTLPDKAAGSGYITIRTSAPDSALPLPGTRITPAYSSALPKILAPGFGSPALQTALSAHHYRLVGLEFGKIAPTAFVNDLIRLGINGLEQTSLDVVAHHLILDRVYIHGDPTSDLKRGIALNSAYTAIIDSYISDIHVIGQDTQAIGGINGPGPFKIVNNYLEAAGENIIFGGDTAKIENLVPSDIEIRRNHFHKPLSWWTLHPSYAGFHWAIKNLFELKNGQRVLLDGNLFENNWNDGQDGVAILLKTSMGGTTATWSVTQDVTFQNNIVRHSGGAMTIVWDPKVSVKPTARITVKNNVFEDIDGPKYGGSGTLFFITGPQNNPADTKILNNTAFHTGKVLYFGDKDATTGLYSKKPRFVFRDNLALHNTYGVFGSGGCTYGDSTLDAYYDSEGIFLGNALVGGPSSRYAKHPGNFFPATWEVVMFENMTAGNYRLQSGSPLKGAGAGGKDVGANIDAIVAAMGGTTENHPPSIDSTSIDPNPALVGEEILFDIVAHDVDGDGLSYHWNFGDGSSSSEKSPIHMYAAAGSYNVQVTVTDSKGAPVSKTLSIAVEALPAVLPAIQVKVSDKMASEAADSGEFTISRTGSLVGGLTVHYEVGGSAKNGIDYESLSGAVIIPEGLSSVTIMVKVLNDSLIEGKETVNLKLIADPAYKLETSIKAALIIYDDELPVVDVSVPDKSAAETGLDGAQFVITRNGDLSSSLTVNCRLGGTATNGSDYEALAEAVVIPAGVDSVTINVKPIEDVIIEGKETISLKVLSSEDYQVGLSNSASAALLDSH
jgi:PKD repeat protein